jgi:2-iminobutanoate/2-iminopropanoate deaminase
MPNAIERMIIPGAISPRGPYSHAVKAGGFIYVAGQGPVDPKTDAMDYGSIEEETRLTLENVRRILEACGATMADVVRCGVYLRNADDFQGMNRVYTQYFGDAKPARTTVVTGFADAKMKVEIDCVAYKP